jgi:predicted AAA+ superfamily ATPase
MRSAAVRCAQPVNYAGLARDAGIDQKTAKSWLGMLEALGIVLPLHPYSNNLLTRTVKSPKLYFYDSGLVAYLVRITTAPELRSSAFMGALFENYAVTEIAKGFMNMGLQPPLYYYRDASQREIDLLIFHNATLFPLEIKSSPNPGIKATRTFELLTKAGIKTGTGAVVSMAS